MVPNDNMNTTAKLYACTDIALGKEDGQDDLWKILPIHLFWLYCDKKQKWQGNLLFPFIYN